MNTTIGEAISNVKSDFRLSHADRRITVKQVYSLLVKFGKRIIKQESDKLKLYRVDSIFQTLSCLETMDVPTSDECCKFTTKCKILRTKDKLPELYEDSWGILIKYIGSLDFSEEVSLIKMAEWERKLDDANFKYNKEKYSFYRNGYLYFPNSNWKLVAVTGYFVDDVHKLNTCEETDETCPDSILDTEWRIPGYLQEAVINLVIQELAQTYMNVPPLPEVHINKNPQ